MRSMLACHAIKSSDHALRVAPPDCLSNRTIVRAQFTKRGCHTAGKFELYTDKAGKFRFRLKAGNGQIIATGEAYETKAAAQNGNRVGAEERAGRHRRRSDLSLRACLERP